MLKNKRLKEAIDGVGMVNNLDSQDFDKKSVGTAPVSYADAVLRARKRKEACKKAYEDQVKVAREALKKEVSNEEHPEPLDKIRGRREGKMTLDEGLFESFDDEHLGHGDDVCLKCGKNPCKCNRKESLSEDSRAEESQDYADRVATKLVRRYYQDGRISLEQLHKELLKVFDGDIKRAFEFLLNFGKKPVKETPVSVECFDGENTGKVELKEWMPSHAVWVKKEGKWKPYSALDFDTLSDEEVAAFKGLGYDDVKLLPNDGSEPDEVETLGECAHTELREGIEEKKVYRITYKHSPEVFSSVMVKAASEDEAKQKLAVKMPDKDIVGVSVMSDYEVKDMINRGMSLMEAKVIDEFSSYEPWGAAVSTFDNIQNAGKMDALEHLIDDMYPDGIDRTELNDLLAFESDWVYSMLDMSNEGDVDEEEDGPAVDFDGEE